MLIFVCVDVDVLVGVDVGGFGSRITLLHFIYNITTRLLRHHSVPHLFMVQIGVRFGEFSFSMQLVPSEKNLCAFSYFAWICRVVCLESHCCLRGNLHIVWVCEEVEELVGVSASCGTALVFPVPGFPTPISSGQNPSPCCHFKKKKL